MCKTFVREHYQRALVNQITSQYSGKQFLSFLCICGVQSLTFQWLRCLNFWLESANVKDFSNLRRLQAKVLTGTARAARVTTEHVVPFIILPVGKRGTVRVEWLAQEHNTMAIGSLDQG